MRRVLRAVGRLVPWFLLAGLGVAATMLFGGVVIAGGSMSPTLTPGDLLLYRRAPVSVGASDVVLLQQPAWQRPVVHRIVSTTTTGGIVTQGDANPVADAEPLPQGAVKGRAVAVVPVGRLVARLAGLVRRARLLLQHQTARR